MHRGTFLCIYVIIAGRQVTLDNNKANFPVYTSFRNCRFTTFTIF